MVNFVVKLKNCQIGMKIGVVVDIDPAIMIVVTKRLNDKKTQRQKDKKDKKAKRLKVKKTKRQKGKKTKRQKYKNTKKQKYQKKIGCLILEQGGQQPPQFLVDR